MSCEITKTQNQQEHLIELAAMRQLYAQAKTWNAIQFLLTVIPAIAWAIVLMFKPDLKVYATVSGLSLAMLEILFFEARQKTLLKSAARIQEQFDCGVLQLPWNSVKTGASVDPEDVNAAAARYRKRTGDTHFRELSNWYRTTLDALPLFQARLLAQRSSVRWDRELRRKYRAGVLGLTITVGILLVLAGLMAGMSLSNFVLIVVLPWIPVLVWGTKEIKKQDSSIRRAEELKSGIERAWKTSLDGSKTPEELHQLARALQDELFDHRSTNAAIFDWVYSLKKNSQEEDMHAAVDALVKEAQQRS